MVFDADTQTLQFRGGPVFAHVLLDDEINRTSPKVQSALLEAMAEHQVTIDNATYPLDELFFVIATQNPSDAAGTYPLPAAQLDRFLFRITMDHVDRVSELEVLRADRARPGLSAAVETPHVTLREVVEARRALDAAVFVHETVDECLVDIARSLREHPEVRQGVSTRCLVLMKAALRATAALRGRDYVTEEDVWRLAGPVFGHRLLLETSRTAPEAVIEACLRGPLETLSRSTLAA
jgi:MoxR-like ATPase